MSDTVIRSYLSDNAVGASPEILTAVTTAATGIALPYGNDELSRGTRELFSALFDHPVDVFPVVTGSAANGLALAALTPPWGAVLCHAEAHITNDEAGAPEFFTTGAKLLTVAGTGSKIDPAALEKAVHHHIGDVHTVQPAVVSLTQATESGEVYTLEELQELTTIAHAAGVRVHMDGARFANALVALDCSPAAMTWQVGVDIVSFGATKNGAMTADAVVSFDPALATELAYRHKRAGQLTSKMRFQTAQLEAYLTDGLWLRNATQANAMAARLRAGLSAISGVSVLGDPKANIVFAHLPDELITDLREAGFSFYDGRWEPGTVRFVTSFAHQHSDIDLLLTAAAARSGTDTTDAVPQE